VIKKNLLEQAGLASLVMGLALASAPAFAQQTTAAADDAAAEETIVVTGSRIAGLNIEQANPVVAIGAEELTRQAPSSIEQVLRDLPGSSPGIGQQVNNGNGGVATFNLRGLGSNRNLVLMNNRRVVPSTLGGVVDLNIIPIALIERADVFTGGAVTSYGADAIAGVVNFVTKRNFEGLSLTSQFGMTERGDGNTFRIDGVMGGNFADGRGNVVIGIGYTKVDPVLQGNRQVGEVSRGSTCTAAQNAAAGGCAAALAGTPQGSVTAAPATLLNPLPATGAITGATGAQFGPNAIIPGNANFNFNPLNLYQAPLDRWNVFLQGQYEVTSGIEVYAEAFYTRSRVNTALAPTGTFSQPFQVPLNNQFLTPTMRQQLCEFSIGAGGGLPVGTDPVTGCATAIAAGTEITVSPSRRFVEAGPRRSEFVSNVFQVTAGVRGKLTSTLNFDLFGQYGEADRRNTSTGNALTSRVQEGLRNCPTGSTAGCVPINLFGQEGSITPAMLNFIGFPASTFVKTGFESVQGIINGDLGFSSPFADTPIGIAVGAEYRKYSGAQSADALSSTPGAILGAGGAALPFNGAFHSTEFYGELVVPVVADKPFFHDLTVDAGFRYADYSTTGGNWTFKGGVQWAPIPDIRIRGAWTRAIRAPNLSELLAPPVTGLNNLAVDPCQLTLGNANATVSAICTAQLAAVGVPASGLGNIPTPIAGQINVTTGGNAALQPEQATTWSAGVVLQPRFLNGFTLTVDWYRVSVTDAVSAPTVSDVLNGCFAAGQTDPNFALCQLIRRNPLNGGLSGDPASTQGLILQSSNLGFIQNEGIDLTANYMHDFGGWKLNWNVQANHTLKSRFQSQPASIIRECVGFYSVSCDPVLPEWTVNMRTTAMIDKFDISVLWRYISGTSYEPRTVASTGLPGVVGSFGSTAPGSIVGAYRNIPAFHWFDLNFGYDISDNLRFSMLVENLFDRKAPDVGNTIGSTAFNSGNTFPSTYDALGRRYTATIGVRF
jgi:outer membrane receptor protein involved in Fe transport